MKPQRLLRAALTLAAALAATSTLALAQSGANAPAIPADLATPSDLVADARAAYNQTKSNILRAAEQMPAADYAFKPTPEVRSFGQLMAHIADFQFVYCGAAKRDPQAPRFEEIATTKPDILTALRAGFVYCDELYNHLTDLGAMQKVPLYGGTRARVSVLNTNVAHNQEHYGNLVTYIRLMGMVPPSSQPRQ